MKSENNIEKKRAAIAQERLVRRLGSIIADEVGFFNGWRVDEKAQRGACERAALRIIKMKRFRLPNA